LSQEYLNFTMTEEGCSAHPQPQLQKLYSAGRGGYIPSRGRGRGAYNNRHNDNDDSEENNSSSSEENSDEKPAYLEFLNKYDKNYKNPIFHMLYKKPLETEEDIRQYREERRRNYPTKANLERKEKEIEERLKKGEVIVSANERVKPMLRMMGIIKDDDYKNERQGSGNRGRGSFTERGRGRGRGRGAFSQQHTSTSSSENIITSVPKPTESIDDILPKVEKKSDKPNSNDKQYHNDRYQRGHSRADHGVKKRYHEDNRQPHIVQQSVADTSLLKKLLVNEIHKEKSILLQCFRYIINQRFFCQDSDLSSDILTKLKQIDEMNQRELEQWKQYRGRNNQQRMTTSTDTVDIEKDEENEQDKEIMNVTKEDEAIVEALISRIGDAAAQDDLIEQNNVMDQNDDICE
jgi:hypothetical protein